MEYHWSDDFDTYEEWVKHEEKKDDSQQEDKRALGFG